MSSGAIRNRCTSFSNFPHPFTLRTAFHICEAVFPSVLRGGRGVRTTDNLFGLSRELVRSKLRGKEKVEIGCGGGGLGDKS